jgi:hypothetical protein
MGAMGDIQAIAELRTLQAQGLCRDCGCDGVVIGLVADHFEYLIGAARKAEEHMDQTATDLRIAEERVAFLRNQVIDLCTAIEAKEKKIRKLEREARPK